jgi:2-polyprenyl-6-methoxyphenol hydroxylase-like FAD-dependent oxidoreductase
VFGDRQLLLQALYMVLKDKSKILMGKKVQKVDQHQGGITVHCQDGTTYQGDIVAGAEGCHSTVRREMWRLGNAAKPNTFTDKEMKCEQLHIYAC